MLDDVAAWKEAMKRTRDFEDSLKPGQSWQLQVEESDVVFIARISSERCRR